MSHLIYKYNHQDTQNALDNITFNVDEGEWLSIIGPNGSGKSTLVKAIDGLIHINNENSVLINGQSYNKNANQIRSQIGMVFQNPDNQFIASTVEDDVAFGLENRNIDFNKMKTIVEQSLKLVGMYEYRDSKPENLSGGQKQRVALAGIISLKPRIILLDEATSMLDPNGKISMLNLIRKIKQKFHLTIISVTHDVNEVEYSNQTLILKHGKIINKAPSKRILLDANLLWKNGLDIPFYRKLIYQLKQKKIHVPSSIVSEKELLKWVIQSSLMT